MAKLLSAFSLVALSLPSLVMAETQVSVTAAAEYRFFQHDALFDSQHNGYLSAFVEPEIYHSWNDDMDSVTFKPFLRWDQHDSERTHGDIRELMWLHVGDDWELRTGIGSVFWGQTESQHLVDVINQTDSVEAVDGEDKLGQQMLNLTLIRDWGNLDLFVLPGFRERTFAGEQGRLRPALLVDQDEALYQSSSGKDHVDLAARWTHTLGDWDLGLSYFDGTSRDPILQLAQRQGELKLLPYYAQMQQVGVDMLAVIDAWLLKFEGIYRDTDGQQSYMALTTGFEYTSVGVFDSVWDIGWLLEYQFDDRDELATGPGQNDLMFGSRLVFNDVEGTEILIAMVQDLDQSSSRSAFVEASSRINDNWKWRADVRLFSSDLERDPLYGLRQDDVMQFSLEYYF